MAKISEGPPFFLRVQKAIEEGELTGIWGYCFGPPDVFDWTGKKWDLRIGEEKDSHPLVTWRRVNRAKPCDSVAGINPHIKGIWGHRKRGVVSCDQERKFIRKNICCGLFPKPAQREGILVYKFARSRLHSELQNTGYGLVRGYNPQFPPTRRMVLPSKQDHHWVQQGDGE